MATSLKVRCTQCNIIYDTKTPHDTTPTCPVWELVIVETNPSDSINDIYMHPSGVAFYAYDEAAKAGSTILPEGFGTVSFPADSDAARQTTLETRLDQAINVNSTYLAKASPTNAESLAQVKALTIQVQAMVRLMKRNLSATD